MFSPCFPRSLIGFQPSDIQHAWGGIREAALLTGDPLRRNLRSHVGRYDGAGGSLV